MITLRINIRIVKIQRMWKHLILKVVICSNGICFPYLVPLYKISIIKDTFLILITIVLDIWILHVNISKFKKHTKHYFFVVAFP
jgi:hypothetical protein